VRQLVGISVGIGSNRRLKLFQITGVNTNSCVLATTTAANVRDYAVIVVKDCVETMDGPALHEAGLLCIKTAFGLVLDTTEIMALNIFAAADKSAA
jgi:biuret amidohydrolase